jgi:nickel-dependent lactate racemase
VPVRYGKSELSIQVPDDTTVLTPKDAPALNNIHEVIRYSLRHPINSKPLIEQVHPGDRIVVTFSDITRATPRKIILPIILDELHLAGIRDDEILLVNALGTHRKQNVSELEMMLGKELLNRYHCIQHDAYKKDDLIQVGSTYLGHPIRLNRWLVEADFKILTGYIEPHFFAGFSGGPKAILPALAGSESVFTNHGYDMISHPNAIWGVMKGNPIWEEMAEASQFVNPSFLVDVTLNRQKGISGLFAGDVLSAHQVGCQFAAKYSMKDVDKLFDVVIVTNGGYPLDQNLYQCVKGISAARKIVRKGGAILMVAECSDGVPEYGMYGKLLIEGGFPQAVLDMVSQPGFLRQDQWQVQIQAMIQLFADVYVYSTGLSDEQIRKALFFPCGGLEYGIAELLNKYGSSLCVLPDGPQVIPCLV